VTKRITIVGLGLTGRSIGLGLKQQPGGGKAKQAAYQIVGHDKDSNTARAAAKLGCVDATDWNLINACDGVDLVVICTPLLGIQDTLRALAQDLKPGCVVMDTASLKAPVLDWARACLPPTVHFVGGHLIIDKRAEEPSADLLAGAVYCLTPGTDTLPEALQTASGLVEAMGAVPYFVDPVEHDSLVAAVHQMPLLLAMALQAVTATSPAYREMAQLTSASFNRITAVLDGDPESMAALCTANASNLVRWLDALMAGLSRLRGVVAEQDSEALHKSFVAAQSMRERWLRGEIDAKGVDYGDVSMARMFLGDLFKPLRQEGQ